MSKNSIYSQETLINSRVGRAVAHGARIEILKEINDGNITTNQFMAGKLGLSTATIHNHVKMLLEAELVEKEYFRHFGIIRKTGKYQDLVDPFVK